MNRRNFLALTGAVLPVSSVVAGCSSRDVQSSVPQYGNITVERSEEIEVDSALTNGIRYGGEDDKKVRYAGITVPFGSRKIEEIPDTLSAVRCIGNKTRNASEYLESKIPEGKRVTAVYERGMNKSEGDIYNSVYIWVDDSNDSINRKLVKKGLAFANRNQSFDQKESFRQAEQTAKENNRGIWQCREKTDSILGQSGSEGGACNNDGDPSYDEDNDRDNDGICDED